MSKELLITQVTQAVLPTPILLLRLHTEGWALLAMEFLHDGTGQLLDVTVKRRASRTGSFAPSDITDFLDMVADVPYCADLDVRGCVDVEFWGTASGVGMDVVQAGLLVGDV